MYPHTGEGRLLLLFACAVLAAACVSRETVSIRPKYIFFESEIEFDDPLPFVIPADDELDADQERYGIEVAGKVCPFAEFYGDLLVSNFEYDAKGSPDGEGWAAGVGFRSLIPEEEGWFADYGARIGYARMDDDDLFILTPTKYDWKAWEGDINLGAQYALMIEEDIVLAPRAGGFFKGQWGRFSAKWPNITGLGHYSYELESFGLYGGARMEFIDEPGLELGVNGFFGTEELAGFMAVVGIRF